MRIGKRLSKVLSLIDNNLSLAIDIGTDHGFLALKLIEEKNTKLVLATDISEGSLQKAQKLAIETNNVERLVCLLSDGFINIPMQEKVDVVVIAGMGGNETVKVLSQCGWIKNIKEFVLQPMQDVEILREYLLKNGFSLYYDETVKDRGKFYHVIKCGYNNQNIKYEQDDIFIGVTDKNNLGVDFIDCLKEEVSALKSREQYLNNRDRNKLNLYLSILSQRGKFYEKHD